MLTNPPPFTIKHKSRKMNQGADALSIRHLLLFQLDACILGFKHLKALYENDEDFGVIYEEWHRHLKGDFLIQDGYLFKGTRLCVSKCGTRELLIREVHKGSLTSHMERTRHHLCLKSTTIGQAWTRMCNTSWEGVQHAKFPRVIPSLKGYTPPCWFPPYLGWMWAWTLCWV